MAELIYERAGGVRAVGEHPEGFAVTVSRTIGVPAGRLYEAFVEDSLRRAPPASRRAFDQIVEAVDDLAAQAGPFPVAYAR